MKTKLILVFLTFLVFLPAMFSCESEEPQESNVPKKEFRIRAYIDNPENSRAAIEYGYQDSIKEVFTWGPDAGRDREYITLFNLSKFSEFHQSRQAPFMYLDKIVGKQAEFKYYSEESDHIEDDTEFFRIMEPGDIILAVVCEAHAANLEDCAPGYSNVFSYQASSLLYDQKIVENPTTATAMRHVHKMLRMYDVVKVGENKEIPDLHFKHFSSIFRVTLQNKTEKPLFNRRSEIVFTASSDERRTFIYGFNYFSVVGNENDGFHLEENFKETPERHPLNPTKPDTTVVLSHKAIHEINKSNGETLNDGETYEFYAVVTPRIGNPEITPEVVESLTIDVFDGGSESSYYSTDGTITKPDRYTITIKDFKRPIEPGKRYWFKLTATNDTVKVKTNIYDDNTDNVTGTTYLDAYKLMFTSEWEDKHNQQE